MQSNTSFEQDFKPRACAPCILPGHFPMAGDDGVIQWYCPENRCIMDLEEFHASKRLMRTYRQGVYDVRVNQRFEEVMWACADREETWINDKIVSVYSYLNQHGLAHSVEAYEGDNLVGGLYGVAIGGAFMGESMFHRATDASKVCLVFLIERMKERGYVLLDSQYMNKHLASFNARTIPKLEYLARLEYALTLKRRFD